MIHAIILHFTDFKGGKKSLTYHYVKSFLDLISKNHNYFLKLMPSDW